MRNKRLGTQQTMATDRNTSKHRHTKGLNHKHNQG